MAKRYFHPSTEDALSRLASELPQSLLITGPVGIGLSGFIDHLSEGLTASPIKVLPERDEKIDIEKGTISIDSIRRLYDLTKTIETGKRVVVIDYAERMGTGSQNAFLKLLEEPGVNTYFILLTHEPSKLLPTIHSRVHRFDVKEVTLEQSNALLDELQVSNATKRAQILFIAAGLPAEISRLSTDEEYFDQRVQVVRDARDYLGGSTYGRIVLASKYKDDRAKSLLLLSDAMKLVKQNVTAGKVELLPKIDQLLRAYERVEANGNIRLQLAVAMV